MNENPLAELNDNADALVHAASAIDAMDAFFEDLARSGGPEAQAIMARHKIVVTDRFGVRIFPKLAE